MSEMTKQLMLSLIIFWNCLIPWTGNPENSCFFHTSKEQVVKCSLLFSSFTASHAFYGSYLHTSPGPRWS